MQIKIEYTIISWVFIGSRDPQVVWCSLLYFVVIRNNNMFNYYYYYYSVCSILYFFSSSALGGHTRPRDIISESVCDDRLLRLLSAVYYYWNKKNTFRVHIVFAGFFILMMRDGHCIVAIKRFKTSDRNVIYRNHTITYYIICIYMYMYNNRYSRLTDDNNIYYYCPRSHNIDAQRMTILERTTVVVVIIVQYYSYKSSRWTILTNVVEW